jgi:hypothetical protein
MYKRCGAWVAVTSAAVVLITALAVLGPRCFHDSDVIAATATAGAPAVNAVDGNLERHHKPKRKPYTSPSGLFIQVSLGMLAVGTAACSGEGAATLDPSGFPGKFRCK